MYSRIFLALLLISSIHHAVYLEPPLESVTQHNHDLAYSLNNSFVLQDSVNGTMSLDFYGTDYNWVPIHRHVDLPLIRASARLLTIEPAVDNSFSATKNPYLIFAWGNESDELEAKDWEKIMYVGDDCIESQNNSFVSRYALIDFSYNGIIETVNATDNIVPIPTKILNAIQNTSGNDSLDVHLNSTFIFTYIIDDRIPTHEGCRKNLAEFSSVINVLDQKNFTSAGNNTLFFLVRPVLLEQWYKNNHFDLIVLSNSKIYNAQISTNQNQSKNFKINEFNVTEDDYGLRHIVTIPLNITPGLSETIALNNPNPLDQENSSYSYLYEFNYSYEGIGENTLEIEMRSVFGDNHTFSRKIMSRALSHSGNISEFPGIDQVDVRKSSEFELDQLNMVFLNLGLVGVLAILLLARKIIR